MEINRTDDLDLGKDLKDLIFEAYKQAIKEDIRANTIMISEKFAKVNRFYSYFGGGIHDCPPMICGLEAYVTAELPDEFSFGLVEAPTTQREHYLRTGYDNGVRELAKKCKEIAHTFTDGTNDYKYVPVEELDRIVKELLEEK